MKVLTVESSWMCRNKIFFCQNLYSSVLWAMMSLRVGQKLAGSLWFHGSCLETDEEVSCFQQSVWLPLWKHLGGDGVALHSTPICDVSPQLWIRQSQIEIYKMCVLNHAYGLSSDSVKKTVWELLMQQMCCIKSCEPRRDYLSSMGGYV